MPETVEKRLTTVESVLAEFIIQSNRSLHRLEREMRDFKDEMKDFKDEMKDFKDEMGDFKDEMKVFKDEMSDFKDEMKVFKDEMSDFKDEMKVFKDEMRQDRKDLNKKWGDLSNKLGTFAEDVAAPNIPRIAAESFGEPIIYWKALRLDVVNPSDPQQEFEFDGIFLGKEKVFLLESKFTVREKYINFLPTILERYKLCFPQYDHLELVPIFASMSISQSNVNRLTKLGIYAMAMGDENMDLLNFDDIQKRKKK